MFTNTCIPRINTLSGIYSGPMLPVNIAIYSTPLFVYTSQITLLFYGHPVIYGLIIRSGSKTCTAGYPNSSCVDSP